MIGKAFPIIWNVSECFGRILLRENANSSLKLEAKFDVLYFTSKRWHEEIKDIVGIPKPLGIMDHQCTAGGGKQRAE